MDIKVLGTGCSSCKAMFENVAELVEELGIEANVVKEEDLMKIMSYNVLSIPALVIDEKVVAKGPHNRKALMNVLKEYMVKK